MSSTFKDILDMRLDKVDDSIIARELLESHGYFFHHRATDSGYISKKKIGYGKPEPYNGRFGVGIKVRRHNPLCEGYMYVEYWIKE